MIEAFSAPPRGRHAPRACRTGAAGRAISGRHLPWASERRAAQDPRGEPARERLSTENELRHHQTTPPCEQVRRARAGPSLPVRRSRLSAPIVTVFSARLLPQPRGRLNTVELTCRRRARAATAARAAHGRGQVAATGAATGAAPRAPAARPRRPLARDGPPRAPRALSCSASRSAARRAASEVEGACARSHARAIRVAVRNSSNGKPSRCGGTRATRSRARSHRGAPLTQVDGAPGAPPRRPPDGRAPDRRLGRRRPHAPLATATTPPQLERTRVYDYVAERRRRRRAA